jgi:hypothetical protein
MNKSLIECSRAPKPYGAFQLSFFLCHMFQLQGMDSLEKRITLKTDLGSQLNVAISHLILCEGPPSSLSGEMRPQKQNSHNNTSHERSAEYLAAWDTQHSSFIQFNIE